MEPKFSNSDENFRFPKEPGFNEAAELSTIPRIVPAEFKAGADITAADTSESVDSAEKKAAQKLMASLAADLDELSKPLDKNTENKPSADSETVENTTSAQAKKAPIVAIPVDEACEENRQDFIDNQDDEVTPSGVGRLIRRVFTLCICLIVVAVSVWQVALFLQPPQLQQEPYNRYVQQSCEYFYCPPLKNLRILDQELNATAPGQWLLIIKVQNQDLRTQILPLVQLTLENTNKTVYQKTFSSTDYKVYPNTKRLGAGEVIKIEVPLSYTEGRPSSFLVKLLKDK